MSHHQAYLFPGGQPFQEFTAQLVAQDAGLAQAALQGLLILLAGVWAPPRCLEDVVDNAHNILPQAAVESQHHTIVLELHLGQPREMTVKTREQKVEHDAQMSGSHLWAQLSLHCVTFTFMSTLRKVLYCIFSIILWDIFLVTWYSIA